MRRIIISEFITVDGVVEAPGGEPGFKYTGWSAEYFSNEYLQYKLNELKSAGALLLGRKTYEGFADAWPGRTDEMGFAERMNSLPKYVVSTTLKECGWNNSHLISTNVAEEIRSLRSQEGGNILVTGSATLVQTLMQNDLVDEYRLMIHPTILGTGRQLYPNIGERKKLRCVDLQLFPTGTIVAAYRPAENNDDETNELWRSTMDRWKK